MKSGSYMVNPAENPAVLDTLTWDAPSLVSRLKAQPQTLWKETESALIRGQAVPPAGGLKLYGPSIGRAGKRSFLLVEDEDGQCAVAEFAPEAGRAPENGSLLRIGLREGSAVFFHEANVENLYRIYRLAAPEKLPQALPMKPRLGIGTRMSKAMWPGIWQALKECPFSANTIQNSLRELNLLENVRGRKLPQKLYYPGIGFVPEGHTGSTFEGLWLCGVTEGLKAGVTRPYGADADHLMVKRGADGLERIKKVLTAARHYSFFTIDVSDILDYSAFPGASGGGTLEKIITDEKTRKEVLAYYKKPLTAGGRRLTLSEAELAGLAGKYWQAMEAMDELIPFIDKMRNGERFDLELSIDEHPPEILPFDCLTSELELTFIVSEMKRRGKTLSHVAPNLGVEKHFDYRYHDGLEGLEARTRALHRIAGEADVVLDCHSGDDLSEDTCRALKRATDGHIHFKISPRPQDLFADVLYDVDREMFRTWWDDTFEFARENAREGSAFAADCLERYEQEPEAQPHPRHTLFRIYGYATVGKRDADGEFLYRQRFYSLSGQFYEEFTLRLKDYLCRLAADLLP